MRSTITLNGINSNTITGLLIQNLPPISKPLMRTQIEEIDGRDGDVITKLGFSAYNKEITIGLYGDFDINQIIQYFTSQGTVVFSNEPDKYYYYQIIDQIDFERLIRYRTATVTMHCQPFKYSTTEGTQVFDNSSNLLTIPNSTTTTNGVTVTANNNILTISGTASAATEFYIPIDTLSLSVGKYGMYALGSGTNPEACSLRVIYNSPSNANSFGGNYVTLKNNQTVSLIANLSNAKTYNYVYLYIAANKAMDFTLNLSIEDAAQSVVTGEGNLITLEGTAFAPFDKFDLKGNTTQQTYSGKNICSGGENPSNNVLRLFCDTTKLSKTFSVSVDSTVNTTGVSLNVYYGSGQSFVVGSSDFVNGQRFTGTFTMTDDQYALVSGGSGTYIQFYKGGGFAGFGVPQQPQIENSASSTSYEPYVGGIPAPNPDYPQEVQVVTGEQTVTITDGAEESQEYEVNLGKNLLDTSTATSSNQSRLSLTIGNDSISYTLVNSSSNWGAGILFDVDIKKGETYTLKAVASSGIKSNVRFSNGDYDTSGQYQALSDSGIYNTNGETFTANNNYSQMRIFLVNSSHGGVDSGSLSNLQLEEGSTATTYAPYFTPIELCKIGTYEDYIYKSSGNWYVHKETNKVILDGSETYTSSGQAFWTPLADAYALKNTDDEVVNGTINYLKSNSFSVTGLPNLYNDGETGMSLFSVVGIQRLMVNIAGYNQSQLVAKITSIKPAFYYALSTPTDTQITNADLISQLEALVTDAHAYKNTTTLVSTSQQLPHIMSVEVAKNNDATITNSGNTTAKPVMTVYGSGTVGIYLNGNQIFNVNIGNNQYITIDTANMEAYKDTTDNLMNRLVDGDYSNFVLQTGENQISFSGSVSKLEISNYSRWI